MATNLGRRIISQLPRRSFVATAGTAGNPRLSSGFAGPPRPRPRPRPNGYRLRRGNPVAYPPPIHVTALKMMHLFLPSKTTYIVSFFGFWGIDRIVGGGYEETVKLMIKEAGEQMEKAFKETGLSRFMVFEAKENKESGSAAASED